MDWTQVLAIIGSNIALILFMFGTTFGMWIHMDNKLESALKRIREEMKDFHEQLIRIEERNKNKE